MQRLSSRQVYKAGNGVLSSTSAGALPSRHRELTGDSVRGLRQRQMLARHVQVLPPARASRLAAQEAKDQQQRARRSRRSCCRCPTAATAADRAQFPPASACTRAANRLQPDRGESTPGSTYYRLPSTTTD